MEAVFNRFNSGTVYVGISVGNTKVLGASFSDAMKEITKT